MCEHYSFSVKYVCRSGTELRARKISFVVRHMHGSLTIFIEFGYKSEELNKSILAKVVLRELGIAFRVE